mmetsp:Transcript_45118/g.107286  ORF Transcript_45118/g.107286 Transcript_45118/m.107286 type:complete len:747 (+) Transcript_45118:81-2321(+)
MGGGASSANSKKKPPPEPPVKISVIEVKTLEVKPAVQDDSCVVEDIEHEDQPKAQGESPDAKQTDNADSASWAWMFSTAKKVNMERQVTMPLADLAPPVEGKNAHLYTKVELVEPEGILHGHEAASAAKKLLRCLAIRSKYIGDAVGKPIEPKTTKYKQVAAVLQDVQKLCAEFDGECALSATESGRRIEWSPEAEAPLDRDPTLSLDVEHGICLAKNASGQVVGEKAMISVEEFCRDYVEMVEVSNDRDCMSFCLPRLKELELKFELYTHRNAAMERQIQRGAGRRDFYQVRKVDTHIHHSAAFSQRQLMKFIRQKMRDEKDVVVAKDKGKEMTLAEVFNSAGISNEADVHADNLCVAASLGGCGHHDTFGRFDRFNNKYNPFGDKRLRDIFLKTDNQIDGRYLAELTQEVMKAHHQQKFVCAEWRISIYGRNRNEWARLGAWFRKYKIMCPEIRWLIQVPRLYKLFKGLGAVKNFADVLLNVFQPLFEATIDPKGNEDIHYLLQQVVGFDSVDDESIGTSTSLKVYPKPEDWTSDNNPPYTYWMYHMYANIRSLNALRRHRGLSTFTYRPHCGEAGNVSHLCSTFMVADNICHGIKLQENVVLQYLFYLAQVGLAVSPLSNDILFLPLHQSPFGTFFRRGLNVSLSTDDPLIIHMTEEALIEEYVIAARTFRLSVCDLCEIARNSVLQCGFERAFKEWWIGSPDGGPDGNDEAKTNVPTIRLKFRKDCLDHEMALLKSAAAELP